jgi:hypothetical protein
LKKLRVVILTVALATAAFAVGTWEEYKPECFEAVTNISDVAFNAAGTGFAASNTQAGGKRNYVWKYARGEWIKAPDPYEKVARLTVGSDGSCYALAEGGRTIFRLSPGAQYWQSIGDPYTVGMDRFVAVVGVGAREYWAAGRKKTDGHGLVIYYLNDQPRQIFDLGLLNLYNDVSIQLDIPRSASPGGEAYAVSTYYSGIQPEGEYRLYVLKPSGEISNYKVPISTRYACGGLVARAPGVLLVSFHIGDSIIFAFLNGIFTELARYPGRCDVRAYPASNEGWGVSYQETVYHWTNAGPSEKYVMSGRVRDLDFINPGSGWAVGQKQVGSVWVGMMWRYTSDVAVTPTSLGCVKALFR